MSVCSGSAPQRAIVVGAGLSGLACATALTRAGVETLVLEQSRGLGGRLATWRVDGQPVDYGAAFYHGREAGFLEALRSVPGAAVVEGWPTAVEGRGTPCQPGAYGPHEQRLAFADGMTVFPKHLARSLSVRRQARVSALGLSDRVLTVRPERGAPERADAVVLSVPPAQARTLLQTLPESPYGCAGLMSLHRAMSSTPCLTLMAGYPPRGPLPPWDLLHPDDSRILQTVSHDSSKRPRPTWTVLTLQAHAAWSREWFDRDPADWAQGLIQEAGRLCGAWATRPSWTRPHRWKYARVTGDSGLAHPLVLRQPGGARIGLTGDAFGPTGSAEAAWRSGHRIAERLLRGETTDHP